MHKVLIFLLSRYRIISRITIIRKIFVFIVVVGIAALLVPWVVGTAAKLLYNKQNYSGSKSVWQFTHYVSWNNRDIPRANMGNAQFRLKDYPGAIASYEDSLKRAPAKRACIIRWNLSLALRQIGDAAAVEKPVDAIREYARAVNVLSDPTCLNNPAHKKQWQQTIDELNKLIEELSRKERAKKDKKSTNTPSDNKDAASDEEKQAKMQQLQIEYLDNQTRKKVRDLPEDERFKAYDERVW